MAIHGYSRDGKPKFDNVEEYEQYLKIIERQSFKNRNKRDWMVEMSQTMEMMMDLVNKSAFQELDQFDLDELDKLKKTLDTNYKCVISAPKKRSDDTSIVSDFLSSIVVLDDAKENVGLL